MKSGSYRFVGLISGVLLGLGAPIGCLLLKWLLEGFAWQFSSIRSEVDSHLFFYTYMTFSTPVAFMFFGGYLGGLIDRLNAQHGKLQYLMSVVQKQSITDEATGVYNRHHLFAQIQKELMRSARYEHTVSGMMIDLDWFKDVNDRFGHPTGDLLLREVAEALIRSVRAIDTVGRYGGDEFFILMPESDRKAVASMAARVLQNIQKCRLRDQPELPPTSASIGIASFSCPKGVSPEEFVAAVDQALSKAKSLGKNRIFQAD